MTPMARPQKQSLTAKVLSLPFAVLPFAVPAPAQVIWQEVSAQGPAPRINAGMAYDQVREVAVLFGGYERAMLEDTWEFDGRQWRQVAGAGPVRG